MDTNTLESVFSEWSNAVETAFGNTWSVARLPKGTIIEVMDLNESHVEGSWRTNLFVVLKITQNGVDQFFKKTGFCASHDGEHWDGSWTEVVPEQRFVTTWADVENDVESLEDSFDSYDSYF